MRLPIISLVATFCLSAPIFAAAPSEQRPANVEEDVLGIPKKPSTPEKAESVAGSTSSADTADGSTTFNGITVPPLKEIKGDAFDDEIKDGYWYAAFIPHPARRTACKMVYLYVIFLSCYVELRALRVTAANGALGLV